MKKSEIFSLCFAAILSLATTVDTVAHNGGGFLCWSGKNEKDLKEIEAGPGEVCVSYKAKCSRTDDICTQEEIDGGKTVIGSAVVKNEVCQKMVNDRDQYQDVVCCSLHKCNTPAFLDFEQQPADLNGDGKLTCFVGNSNSNPVETKTAEPGTACAHYKQICLPGVDGCTEEQIINEVYIEKTDIVPMTECHLIVMSNHLKEGKCCTSDLCNLPAFVTPEHEKKAVISNNLNAESYAASAGFASSHGNGHSTASAQAEAKAFVSTVRTPTNETSEPNVSSDSSAKAKAPPQESETVSETDEAAVVELTEQPAIANETERNLEDPFINLSSTGNDTANATTSAASPPHFGSILCGQFYALISSVSIVILFQ